MPAMAARAQAQPTTSANGATPTLRTVIVIDRELPKGLAANAAAVLGHGFGSRVPGLVGADFADAAGASHTGLIPTGLPVLGADAADLPALRSAAVERGLTVVDLPAPGQQTTDYDEFRGMVAATPSAELSYLGVALSGPRRAVGRLTGRLALLR